MLGSYRTITGIPVPDYNLYKDNKSNHAACRMESDAIRAEHKSRASLAHFLPTATTRASQQKRIRRSQSSSSSRIQINQLVTDDCAFNFQPGSGCLPPPTSIGCYWLQALTPAPAVSAETIQVLFVEGEKREKLLRWLLEIMTV